MKLDHYSASTCNLFCASPAMFVLEKVKGRRQPGSAPMFRGIGVEDGVTAGLLNPDLPIEECIAAAYKSYDTRTALLTDKRVTEYRATIPAMVTTALAELRPYGIPSHTQRKVEWQPDGLSAPFIGYLDYQWEDHGVLTDLKTTQTLPSSIKIGHARQTALYATVAGNNADTRVSYVTPKKSATYQLENVQAHLNSLHKIALSIEAFLAQSDDPDFFVSITAPDYDSFYWSGPARQIGFEVWGF